MILDTTLFRLTMIIIGHFARIFSDKHYSFVISIGDPNKMFLMSFVPNIQENITRNISG
ncbi:hypothetical protein PHJA_002950700 [Phtheirospermum japonicum]|uniref:Uncharacterized protein n=1 Tax=Phtheirospermum japonicum TaxID=374723 RepID=A0A830D8I8_9LAMI|nr:hypothetical protein PHJA_002950700 [Phtheirospermum japonicum]